ncbi:hypothetical protein PHSY_002899 [Pseudozyma hubeiensis SY62]|uniref:Pentatricopeptide repeat protein n=1 Tax=Pseudozyma hubeiensis (strain SY62) TaxID=1305764 RepID=R9P276_PSEHS|nr:hypothetical protein PHSY_002899 [Pseudozyma hubeiensis SY62]GAC95324.1 hypothetical protein PHSY_002899 [Pseudozyma hubeiensis SY62]
MRLPSRVRRLARPSVAGTAAKPTPAALPPAFLCPLIHAHPLSVQSLRLASTSSSDKSQSNSAQNLRGALRRTGQASKWSPKPPVADVGAASPASKTTYPKRGLPQRYTAPSPKPKPHDRTREQDRSFRIRAKALVESLSDTYSELSRQSRDARTSPARIDSDITNALAHFESEMKVLRVMLKSKDVLVDPDNSWRSASRIKSPYNTAIRICFQNGKVERAFKLLNQMKKDGIFPGAATYTVLINGLTRVLVTQMNSVSSDRKTEQLLQRKETQRIHELYHDLEKLWKQAYPRYFPRAGIARAKDAVPLDKDDYHTMTEQARRNLVSQQASIYEAQEFPRVLTNAIGAYANFLRVIDANDELDRLFDRLFPPTLIESMARGLMPDASPQEKLELANRKLSDSLPLGDKSSISSFLPIPDAHDPKRFAATGKIWSRMFLLMDIERHQHLSSSSRVSKKNQKPSLSSKSDAGQHDNGGQADFHDLRFVPDDQLMIDTLNRLRPVHDADSPETIRLGLSILKKVYGLELVSAADGIIRDPQRSEHAEPGVEYYLNKDADEINGPGGPSAELRSPTVAAFVFLLLAPARLWREYTAFFNYLWAKEHAEHAADGQTDALVFGKTMQPMHAMKILWNHSQHADPIGVRVLLQAMRRAAEDSTDQRSEDGERSNRRARRPRPGLHSQAAQWKPADVCYTRAMYANLEALSKKPHGLTALTLKEGGKYDVWSEAKSLYREWFGSKVASHTTRQRDLSRWATRGCKNPAYGVKQSVHSHVHADTMRSLLLSIARACANKQEAEGVDIAREALRLLEETEGLKWIVDETQQQLRQDDVQPPSSRPSHSKEASAGDFKMKPYTLPLLSKIISLALDTSQQSFAPKEDVELWKRLRNTLSASASDAIPRTFSGEQTGDARSPRATSQILPRSAGGSQLLLSRDDHLELQAEAEDDGIHEMRQDFEQPRAGLDRRQRRLRHVEQELERWVRGGSSL